MALLVIFVPPRPRLAARASGEPAPATRPAQEFAYVLSQDGRTVLTSGRASPATLPPAEQVVAVLADADVAWQRITLPKAPPARLRAALVGVLEEALLDDDEALHFALPPEAAAGQPTWVAVVHKPWLQATLAALEVNGRVVEKVLPAGQPLPEDAAAQGRFWQADGEDSPLQLAWSHRDGHQVLACQGGLARALLAAETTADRPSPRFTASPAAAGAAEAWLGAPVGVLGDHDRALATAASGWNLRQFDLAPRHKGTLALRDAWRQLRSPAWRPVRWGLATLVLVQLVGLNLWAWRQQAQVQAKQAAMTQLLREAHPGVRAIIDPLAQMQRESERLRAAAGRTGEADLETLLGAAASAWPDGLGPVQSLRYDSGRLTLAAPGWAEAQLTPFRDRLRPAGYRAELDQGRVVLSPGRDEGPGPAGTPGAPPPPPPRSPA
ncbi:MAG: type II secretion system protein GspL [Rubrivivax sp.]